MANGGTTPGQRRLRLGAGVVILALIVVVVLVDVFGRLLIRDTFAVSDVMLGALLGFEGLVIFGAAAKGQWPFDRKDGDRS